MTTGSVTDFYEYALLSSAAYATFPDYSPGSVSEALLASGKFTQEMADDFVLNYQVLAQYNDPATGLSVTLFQAASGQKILSIRGSNDIFDAITDIIDIGILGTVAAQEQYAALNSFYQSLVDGGILGAGESISVTGHSLGGFLAQAFAVDHSDVVTQTYTYNAPGIGGVVTEVLSALGIADSNIAVSNMTNLLAEAGPSLASGLGTMLGNVESIYIEHQSPDIIANHYITTITDSLALYDLFARVDANASTDTITHILESSQNPTNESATLEDVLHDLAAVFGQLYETPTDDRDAYYNNLQAFENYLTQNPGLLTGVSIQSLYGMGGGVLAIEAQTDIAYRYALENLDAFVVTGNTALYDSLDTNGYLDADNFSEQYLSDRGAFLYWVLKSNADDPGEHGVSVDNYNVWPGAGEATYYKDLKTGYELWIGGTDVSVRYQDVNTLKQVIFGSGVNDALTGGGEDDHLYGREGFDMIDIGESIAHITRRAA